MEAQVPKHENIKVLIYVGSYLPGQKSGGPVRSIANLVAQLGDRFEFFVVTRDRDIDDIEPYSTITPDRFCKVGNAKVLYSTSIGLRALLRPFHEIYPDVVYLNSFHCKLTRQMLILRRLGVLAGC